MKRVVILINSMKSGGAERVVSILAEGFRKKKIEVHLLTLESGIVYQLNSEIKYVNLGYSWLNKNQLFKIINIIYYAYKLKRYCSNNNIDVVKSHMYRSNYINILSKILGNKSKCLVVQHSHASNTYSKKSFRSTLSKYLLSYLLPKADTISSVSKLMKLDLEENYSIPPNKSIYVGNPIMYNRIHELISKPVINNLNFDLFTFITVGSFITRKNHELLIKAASLIEKDNFQVVIMGRGKLKEHYLRLIKKYQVESKVFILDFNSNPFNIMFNSHCFVNCSNAEGLPMVLLEALACELPLISSDCYSGPREILAPNSDITKTIKKGVELAEFGILFPTNDLKSLCEAMQLMIENKLLYNKYKNISNSRLSEFTVENIVNNYLELL